MRSIRAVRNLRGQRAILRVDMNVPQDARGRILDDYRIRESLSTIRWVLKEGGTMLIITHWGHPRKRNLRLTVKPIAKRLSQLLHRPVSVVDPVRANPLDYPDPVLMAENIRFWRGEDANEKKFATRLARWGSLYINDAFAESHRATASITGLPRLLPSYAGFLLGREIRDLERIFARPQRPFLVIMGGAKISTKIAYIHALSQRADRLVLGGGIFNTLMAAKGLEIGSSLFEPEALAAARTVLKGKKLLLPTDLCVISRSQKTSKTSRPRICNLKNITRADYICDIGPRSREAIKKAIGKAKTILWNGPLGLIENPFCRKGTMAVARALMRPGKTVVIGGGDLVTLFEKYGIRSPGIRLSTGGGALLQFIAKGTLPGIKALKK